MAVPIHTAYTIILFRCKSIAFLQRNYVYFVKKLLSTLFHFVQTIEKQYLCRQKRKDDDSHLSVSVGVGEVQFLTYSHEYAITNIQQYGTHSHSGRRRRYLSDIVL